jgi:hypothetical protein
MNDEHGQIISIELLLERAHLALERIKTAFGPSLINEEIGLHLVFSLRDFVSELEQTAAVIDSYKDEPVAECDIPDDSYEDECYDCCDDNEPCAACEESPCRCSHPIGL